MIRCFSTVDKRTNWWFALLALLAVGMQGCCDPRISTGSIPDGCVGDYYIFALQGDCGENDWIVTGGDLPPGIELSNPGVLSGRPTLEGTYLFTVTFSPGFDPASKGFAMTIYDADAPECTGQVEDEVEYY